MTMPAIGDDELPEGNGLYHYTNAGGLLGILQSHSLWATHVRYMNDEKEFIFGIEAVLSELADASKTFPVPETKNIIAKFFASAISSGLAETFTKTVVTQRLNLIQDNYGPFLTCLSSERDDLSQWRGYSGYGGYAIGFDVQRLYESVREDVKGIRLEADSPPFGALELGRRHFKKVLYEAESEIIKERLQSFFQQADKDRPKQALDATDLKWIFDLAVRTKHEAFKAENEYRIVTFDKAALFHPGNLGITPRVAIEFDPRCVTEIIVGPGTDMDTRASSIEFFLRACEHYSDVKVVRSEAPFRNA